MVAGFVGFLGHLLILVGLIGYLTVQLETVVEILDGLVSNC